MGNMLTSGAVRVRFSELPTENMSPEEVEQYLRERIEAALRDGFPSFGTAVTWVAFEELVSEPETAVARIRVTVDTTFTVSYDPSDTDIFSWADVNSDAIVRQEADNGNFEVEVVEEDCVIDPGMADMMADDI